MLRQITIKRLQIAAGLLSGLMLGLAFPPMAQAEMAWFALVPLLIVLRQVTPARGFRLAWSAGMLFWLGNLAWLWRLIDNGGPLILVLFGHVALAAYCALYMGLFGMVTAWFWQHARLRHSPWLRLLMTVVVTPLLWVGAEQLRGVLITGFAWNALGVSQYRNLALIQGAAWGGMSVVSALLVAVNGGIARFMENVWFYVVRRRMHNQDASAIKPRRFALRSLELTLALLLSVVCWSHGLNRVRAIDRAVESAPTWKLALFHPEAPSIFEKDDGVWEAIEAQLLANAQLAGALAPDLCVWPETTLPGGGSFDANTLAFVSNITAQTATSLLAGGLEIEPGPGWEWHLGANYYNAAFLFDKYGAVNTIYHKQHLVPFGEYIPGDRRFPWLARLSPIGYSCAAGTQSTIMKLSHTTQAEAEPLRISPLICFEDTLPYLARRAAQAGATLLANLTNDAWFDGSSEAEQHLAQAVFRCVETGLPMVRSSNRGVTGVILPNGRVSQRLGHGHGEGQPGVLFTAVGVPPSPPATAYVRFGPWRFAGPAALLLTLLSLHVIGQALYAKYQARKACFS